MHVHQKSRTEQHLDVVGVVLQDVLVHGAIERVARQPRAHVLGVIVTATHHDLLVIHLPIWLQVPRRHARPSKACKQWPLLVELAIAVQLKPNL